MLCAITRAAAICPAASLAIISRSLCDGNGNMEFLLYANGTPLRSERRARSVRAWLTKWRKISGAGVNSRCGKAWVEALSSGAGAGKEAGIGGVKDPGSDEGGQDAGVDCGAGNSILSLLILSMAGSGSEEVAFTTISRWKRKVISSACLFDLRRNISFNFINRRRKEKRKKPPDNFCETEKCFPVAVRR